MTHESAGLLAGAALAAASGFMDVLASLPENISIAAVPHARCGGRHTGETTAIAMAFAALQL